MAKFTKVETRGELVKFEKVGDSIDCVILKVRSGKTKFGASDFLDVAEEKTGERKSILVSAGLSIYDWEEYKGKLVRIEYTGKVTNDNTGQEYNSFEVYVAE